MPNFGRLFKYFTVSVVVCFWCFPILCQYISHRLGVGRGGGMIGFGVVPAFYRDRGHGRSQFLPKVIRDGLTDLPEPWLRYTDITMALLVRPIE